MNDDLAAFIAARLDEDEAAALILGGGEWEAQEFRDHDWAIRGTGMGPRAVADAWQPETAAHIARHDPARVLREVAAKRAILALHQVHSEPERWGDSHPDRGMRGQPTGKIVYWCAECDDDRDYGHTASREEGCRTLRHLAAIWSDHADYRAEWKPGDPR